MPQNQSERVRNLARTLWKALIDFHSSLEQTCLQGLFADYWFWLDQTSSLKDGQSLLSGKRQ